MKATSPRPAYKQMLTKGTDAKISVGLLGLLALAQGGLGKLFNFFWSRDRSETLRSGPGMLLERFSARTVDSGPDSGHFR